MQTATLSIIMPVYNAAQWIGETIESVLAQTYTDWELLCVDDGSPDTSAQIVQAYAERDARVKLLSKPNGGVSSARNYGIEAARGQYIAFLDADDLALPNMYQSLIDLLEREGSDGSFCAFTRFFLSGKRQTTIETSFPALQQMPQDVQYFFYSTKAVVQADVLTTADIHGSCCRCIFKRSLIKEWHIRFTEGVRFAEDQLFVVDYLQHCRRISYLAEPLLLYRAQTKAWVHHNLYDSHMRMLDRQLQLVEENTYYGKKAKRQLAAYLTYSAYMMVINEDLMFKADAAHILASYDKSFHKLLTFRGLVQKMKRGFDGRKIMLFFLLKLRMYKTVQRIFPNKKYT